MNTDDEVLTLYARVIVLEHLLRSIVIGSLGKTPDAINSVKRVRDEKIAELASMSIPNQPAQTSAIVQARIVACGKAWFDELLEQLNDTNAIKNSPLH